ncbi:MAG TPA: DNA repair protein RecO [Gemmatimonadaceae bacterium]|nr:DNA repair protein RecO [Gemmatimonadaceae bacterium]
MPLIATEAIVLHAFDYLESSRIVRLATREAGLVSVVARGAKRPRSAFGALDLFAYGTAHISVRPQRDLHTLTKFDATGNRISLGATLARFASAAMLSELVMRFGHEESGRDLFFPLARGLDQLQESGGDATADTALAAAWQLVSAMGFAPSVTECANCHSSVGEDTAAPFDLRAGGVLCDRCADNARARRTLPASARAALRAWLAGDSFPLGDAPTRKAHQRLLREFLAEHLSDGRPLTAFLSWEKMSEQDAA